MTEIFKPMKFNILIILLLIIFVSCNVTNKLYSIKKMDGYNYYEQASPQMKIQLFGDYCFQPFKTKYFRDVDRKFINYVTLSVGQYKTPNSLQSTYYRSAILFNSVFAVSDQPVRFGISKCH